MNELFKIMEGPYFRVSLVQSVTCNIKFFPALVYFFVKGKCHVCYKNATNHLFYITDWFFPSSYDYQCKNS